MLSIERAQKPSCCQDILHSQLHSRRSLAPEQPRRPPVAEDREAPFSSPRNTRLEQSAASLSMEANKTEDNRCRVQTLWKGTGAETPLCLLGNPLAGRPQKQADSGLTRAVSEAFTPPSRDEAQSWGRPAPSASSEALRCLQTPFPTEVTSDRKVPRVKASTAVGVLPAPL